MLKKLLILAIIYTCTQSNICTICRGGNRPMCGVDGITYRSRCHLIFCARTKVAYKGICNHCETCQYMPMEPVCGNDGNTYKHECAVRCNGRKVAHKGICYNQCSCNGAFNPVCGINGNTYDSGCQASCYNVQVSHTGECRH